MERHITLPEKTAADLRQKINDGVYQGQLPTFDQLARRYGISRPLMVQAVRYLQSEGLIETHQGRGIFIAGTDKPVRRPKTPKLDNLPPVEPEEQMSAYDVWIGLNWYTWTEQRVAQLNYLKNPTIQNNERFVELSGRHAVCNKLADVIRKDPNNPLLLAGIKSLFRREVSQMENKTLGEALLEIR